MFRSSEDRVVGLEVVLFKQLLAVRNLHIKQGVSHTEKGVRLSHCDSDRAESKKAVVVEKNKFGVII